MPEHPALSIRPLPGIPEISAGDDLVAIIAAAAGPDLQDGDILVVTSKIVSKAEGRTIAADDRQRCHRGRDRARRRDLRRRQCADRREPARDHRGRGRGRCEQHPRGHGSAAAGGSGCSARALAAGLRAATGARVGVILSDTLGRAWRDGQTDSAIGAAGVQVFEDYRGSTDSAGRPLVVTLPCVADELASAADLVKRKTTGMPVAVVRGRADLVGDLDLPGARSIVRAAERDLFHTGAREAWEAGYAAALARGAGSAAL